MLAIKDHLERALNAVSEELRADKVASNFLAGIESTSRELDFVFSRHGISRVEALGEQLDPHKHQAMMEIPSDDAEPGTIVQEMQPGYVLKDRLLRPALVGVAKKPDLLWRSLARPLSLSRCFGAPMSRRRGATGRGNSPCGVGRRTTSKEKSPSN